MSGDVMAIITQREELLSQEKELLLELKRIETDISERKKELGRISDQVRYYSSLVRDMKREMSPSSTDQLFKEI